jgi:integrase/recombinase XerD
VLFELLLGTGMRIGSALGLEAGDVDLEERRLWVRVAKRGKQALVWIDAELAALVAEHLGDRTEGALFESNEGLPISARSVQRRLARWCQRAGLRRAASPHDLRHTYAVGLYRESRDIERVRAALGHESIATTGRYARYMNGGIEL